MLKTKKITYEQVKEILLDKHNLQLITSKKDYKGTHDYAIVSNGIYKATVKIDNYLRKSNIVPQWFYKNNPYILENLDNFLLYENNNKFIRVSDDSYIDRDGEIQLKCIRCGRIKNTTLFNIIRKDDSHNSVNCVYCDEYYESKHAIILKQCFFHYYPDTIFEERSCINPITGKVLPTDIVCNSQRIAIEIQSQFHDNEARRIIDAYKKHYWIERKFNFYALDIRDYSPLEMCQIFFPELKELPLWIDWNYNKKLDVIKIQAMLNEGEKVQSIANKLNINSYRIYDALHANTLYYPSDYKKSNKMSIVQLDMQKKYINTYSSITDAEKLNNIKRGVIASQVLNKSYYAQGSYWIPEQLWNKGFVPPSNKLEKFYVKVDKLDKDGNCIMTYDNCYLAAKDNNTTASAIYRVISGERKTLNNIKYKQHNIA